MFKCFRWKPTVGPPIAQERFHGCRGGHRWGLDGNPGGHRLVPRVANLGESIQRRFLLFERRLKN